MELTVLIEDKSFEQGRDRVRILSNIEFVVRPGAIVGLFGPSGCGKSTLLRITAGLDRDFSGRAMLGSEEITRPTRSVGFVVQSPVCYEWLTVADNLAFGLKYAPQRRGAILPHFWSSKVYDEYAQEELRRIARMVGLSEADLRKRPSDISGGMRQRMAFGRALLTSPHVLLLDEPFSSLDFESRQSLQDTVLRVREELGTSFLCVSHDPEEILFLCNEVLILRGQPATVIHRFTPSVPHYGREEARYTQDFQNAKRELQQWLNLPIRERTTTIIAR
jgi:sulfonate transport system ATP-binding protein